MNRVNEIPLLLAFLLKMGFSGNVIPQLSFITANWLSEHYHKGMSFPLHATSTPTHEIAESDYHFTIWPVTEVSVLAFGVSS
jgi:hypothetical protein